MSRTVGAQVARIYAHRWYRDRTHTAHLLPISAAAGRQTRHQKQQNTQAQRDSRSIAETARTCGPNSTRPVKTPLRTRPSLRKRPLDCSVGHAKTAGTGTEAREPARAAIAAGGSARTAQLTQRGLRLPARRPQRMDRRGRGQWVNSQRPGKPVTGSQQTNWQTSQRTFSRLSASAGQQHPGSGGRAMRRQG